MTTQTKSTGAFIHDDQSRPVVNRTGLLPRTLKPFRCRICNAWFDSVERYSQHNRRHRTKFGWKHPPCKYSVVKCNRKRFACGIIYGRSIKRATREKENLYQCAYCQKLFTQGRILQDHIRIHIKNESYQCGRCQKSFAVISLLQMHIQTHIKKKPQESQNNQHSKTHTEEKLSPFNQDLLPQTKEGTVNCQKCTANEKHVCGVEATEKVYCRIDSSTEKQRGVTNAVENLRHSQNKNSPNTFMHEQVRKDRKKQNQCDYCAKYFISPSHLRVHVKIHTGERNFKCEKCAMSFRRKTDLEIHCKSKSHISGKPRQVRKEIKRPHKCGNCEKSFPSDSHLKAHVATHTDERNYKCEVCDMWFRRRSSLELHYKRKIHLKGKLVRLKNTSSGHSKTCTEEKLYGVKERDCQKSRTDEIPTHGPESMGNSQDTSIEGEQGGIVNPIEKLSQNEKSILGDNMERRKEVRKGNRRRYKCDYCTNYFPSPSHLKAHVAIHSDERNYKCDICNKSFRRRTHLNTHYKTMLHNNNKTQLHSKNNLNRHPKVEPEEKVDVNYLDSHSIERSMNCEKTDEEPISEPRAMEEGVNQNSGSTEKHGIIEANAIEAHQNESGQIKTAPDDPDDGMERSKQAHKERNSSYKCGSCAKCFPSPWYLRKHMATHKSKEDYKFKCNICGKLCSTRGSFKCHRRTCAREKPFKCQFCQQCFAEKIALKRHIVKGHSLDPSKCKHCGEIFAHPDELMGHVRTHKEYQCGFCQEQFSQSSHCREHQMLVHSGKFVHKCNFCGKVFPALRQLAVHIRNHTKPMQCELCEKRFATSSNLKQHMVTHSNEKPFKCDSCSNAYKYKKDLLMHIRMIHTNTELDCEESSTGHSKTSTEEKIYGAKERHCQKSPTDEIPTHGPEAIGTVTSQDTSTGEEQSGIVNPTEKLSQNEKSPSHLKAHVAIHSDERNYSCDICDKSFQRRTNLNIHKTKLHINNKRLYLKKERRFQCEHCQKCFTARGSLKKHTLASHTDVKPIQFQCQYCQKCLSSTSSLKIHIRSHTKERPFPCHICQKGFITKGSLKDHLETHAVSRKQYQCNLCQKSFTRLKGVTQHKKLVHGGERPFQCERCGMCFQSKTTLTVHYRTHTGEKPHTCMYCQRSFAQKHTLIEHIRTHTKEKPYQCEECGKCFTQGRDLKRHQRVHRGLPTKNKEWWGKKNRIKSTPPEPLDPFQSNAVSNTA